MAKKLIFVCFFLIATAFPSLAGHTVEAYIHVYFKLPSGDRLPLTNQEGTRVTLSGAGYNVSYYKGVGSGVSLNGAKLTFKNVPTEVGMSCEVQAIQTTSGETKTWTGSYKFHDPGWKGKVADSIWHTSGYMGEVTFDPVRGTFEYRNKY